MTFVGLPLRTFLCIGNFYYLSKEGNGWQWWWGWWCLKQPIEQIIRKSSKLEKTKSNRDHKKETKSSAGSAGCCWKLMENCIVNRSFLKAKSHILTTFFYSSQEAGRKTNPCWILEIQAVSLTFFPHPG